jgi:hypothetical protein
MSMQNLRATDRFRHRTSQPFFILLRNPSHARHHPLPSHTTLPLLREHCLTAAGDAEFLAALLAQTNLPAGFV